MVRVLLLENIHPVAVKKLTDAGHTVECLPSSLSDEALMKKLDDADILGIRVALKFLPLYLETPITY